MLRGDVGGVRVANQEKGFTDLFGDTVEELSASFYEGVASGREKGADPTVHTRVMLATAYYQKAGNDLTAAQSKVLDDMWLKIRERQDRRHSRVAAAVFDGGPLGADTYERIACADGPRSY